MPRVETSGDATEYALGVNVTPRFRDWSQPGRLWKKGGIARVYCTG
jgi:hypothetical protein